MRIMGVHESTTLNQNGRLHCYVRGYNGGDGENDL